jgi:Na+:H+ antiporter, NhaC family
MQDVVKSKTDKGPHFLVSIVPVIFLIVLLIINVLVYKDDATSGPNQLALLFSAVLAAILGVKVLKKPYKELEKHALDTIGLAMQANIILLIVGSIIGVWILSGVVPTMIYYGIQLISPTVFLPVTCILCAIVSLATGSSWSTGGTIGIALIGIGQTLGIPVGMVAGAIISGAYFGDKMSPLSDTTNLAPAIAGSELFEHIKHMMYSTVPAITIAIILFSIMGFFYSAEATSMTDIDIVVQTIDKHFNIGPHLLLVPLAVVGLVAFRVPAIPSLLFGLFIGIIFALIFQQDLIASFMRSEFSFKTAYKAIITTSYNGFNIETGNKLIDSLFSRGGMSGMLNTVWLILMAMVFSGMMEATGMLAQLANGILKLVRGTASLVAATIGSSIVLNMTASDQYLAIVVTAKLFKSAYKKFGLQPKNLSRAVEDGATVTSVLIPWNSGGAYFSSILGVPTMTYLPYCFFNLL